PGPNLYGMSRAGLSGHFASLGSPAYHGDQAFRWMYARGRLDPSAWSDLPKTLRATLAGSARGLAPASRARAEARAGPITFAIALPGEGTTESVYMIQRERVTLCLSRQVGCALNCDFCLTARMGLVRHLTPGEIVGQVAAIKDDRALADRPFNIVFM